MATSMLTSNQISKKVIRTEHTYPYIIDDQPTFRIALLFWKVWTRPSSAYAKIVRWEYRAKIGPHASPRTVHMPPLCENHVSFWSKNNCLRLFGFLIFFPGLLIISYFCLRTSWNGTHVVLKVYSSSGDSARVDRAASRAWTKIVKSWV